MDESQDEDGVHNIKNKKDIFFFSIFNKKERIYISNFMI